MWVGRLVPVKGLDTLLRAQAMRERGLTPLCAGRRWSERASALEALLARQRIGLGSNIRWLGAVPHDALPDWFRAADVTVLPSLSEGVPNVLLESIACGTPFVASRVGSIPEIADDACDRLVPPGQPEALAAAIIDILTPRAGGADADQGCGDGREFQSRLDTVLGAAVAQRHGQGQTGRQTALRSATLTKPNRWRQVARRALVGAVPRQCLVAAGQSVACGTPFDASRVGSASARHPQADGACDRRSVSRSLRRTSSAASSLTFWGHCVVARPETVATL